MSGLIGKKVGMTQIFDDQGRAIPVTVVTAGPCFVAQVKDKETDGYAALQLGYQELKDKHSTRPRAGHFKKANLKAMRHIREFAPLRDRELKAGDELKVDIFAQGERVKVVGRSKGRGFQGTMKRHGFSGANKTHGQSDRWRAPGSLGQSSYPSRVFKGMSMSGRLGNARVTVPDVVVVRIDTEKNLLFLKGPVPGARNSLVEIRKQ